MPPPIKTEIFAAIIELIGDKSVSIADETPLIGDGSVLDSIIKLVQLCLSLEDKATEFGFDSDWTSNTAMSKSVVFSEQLIPWLLNLSIRWNLIRNDCRYWGK